MGGEHLEHDTRHGMSQGPSKACQSSVSSAIPRITICMPLLSVDDLVVLLSAVVAAMAPSTLVRFEYQITRKKLDHWREKFTQGRSGS
jgi:hypothetical protein